MPLILRRLCHAVLLSVLLAPCVHAASGDADPQFGSGGVTLLDFTALAGAPGFSSVAYTDVDSQGRTWVAAEVIGNGSAGLGLARLDRRGLPDPQFASGGLNYLPITSFSSLIGLRLANDGRAYVAYTDGNGAFTVWRVCRLTSAGAIDSSFFGGCVGAAPAHGAVAHDLQIDPHSGNVWLLGTARDPDSNLNQPVVAIVDVNLNLLRTATFPINGASVDALAGRINSFGSMLFTGSYAIGNSANTDIILGSISDTGDQFDINLIASVAFDLGGSNADVGRCLALTADSKVLIGASVDSGFNGIEWASTRLVFQNAGAVPDPAYDGGGKSAYLIGDPEYGRSSGNYAINACAQGHDGALNMVGSYYFTDPTNNGVSLAATAYRLLPGGARDFDFGGGQAQPGIFIPLEYPGAVLDYYRPASQARPRYDSATSISNVPNSGSLIVGGVSRRTDGSGYSDVAVMRVLTDDIFNSGFGSDGSN